MHSTIDCEPGEPVGIKASDDGKGSSLGTVNCDQYDRLWRSVARSRRPTGGWLREAGPATHRQTGERKWTCANQSVRKVDRGTGS